jgi:hypothetical protein
MDIVTTFWTAVVLFILGYLCHTFLEMDAVVLAFSKQPLPIKMMLGYLIWLICCSVLIAVGSNEITDILLDDLNNIAFMFTPVLIDFINKQLKKLE